MPSKPHETVFVVLVKVEEDIVYRIVGRTLIETSERSHFSILNVEVRDVPGMFPAQHGLR